MSKKVAIVTGASRGLGLAIAKALLAQGYAVVANARNASRTPIEATPQLALIDGDIGARATAERLTRTAHERFGRLDLLVNNAGIFLARPFTDYTDEDYARLISTNLAGFFHMTQSALASMIRSGGGHIINIGTSLAKQPIAGVPSALPILIKGGIEAATRSLAIECAPARVRVNTIAAGLFDTPMHAAETHDYLKTLSPAGRLGAPEEIADAVLYLDGASFVSGEILHIDGGAHAGKWS